MFQNILKQPRKHAQQKIRSAQSFPAPFHVRKYLGEQCDMILPPNNTVVVYALLTAVSIDHAQTPDKKRFEKFDYFLSF